MNKKFLYVLCVMIFITTAALAQTIFVKANVTGANNGSSWQNAYTTLQPALNAATAGTQIWVAAGTYKPTVKAAEEDAAGNPTIDRDKAFVLKADVEIYGGFVGTETELDQRNWKTNLTILSGDLDNNGALSDGGAHHVVIFVGDVGDACLDGFTITGGNANIAHVNSVYINGYNVYRHCGGGVHNINSSPP